MTFFTALAERVRSTDSLLCVGLDPHPADLPEFSAEAALTACLRVVDATADIAAAYKPNSAFFEVHGGPGLDALQRLIAYVGDVPVILDVKRADIASTGAAYAKAAFETMGAGAATVSPWMGWDAIEPWLAWPDHAVFMLCRTSNSGAGDLQTRRFARDRKSKQRSENAYEAVAGWIQAREAFAQVGLVVGATAPEAVRRVRAIAPDAWLLAPGIGKQGGDLEAAVRAGVRNDGMGLLVNASRAISRSEDPRAAAMGLRDAIRRVVRSLGVGTSAPKDETTPQRLTGARAAIADGLLAAGCVRFGEFTLKSGLRSPIYVDLRRITGDPELLDGVAGAYAALLGGLRFDRIAALPYAGLPIGTAVALWGGWPLIYPRQERKSHGTGASIEGPWVNDDRVVLADDLATRGTSAIAANDRLTEAGLRVGDLVVLIDRQSGAADALNRHGIRLHSVFSLSDLLSHWLATGGISATQMEAVSTFLAHEGAAPAPSDG